MPLKNDQYTQIMRIYERRRRTNEEELEKRKKQLYDRYPEILSLKDAYAENAGKRARAAILGRENEVRELNEKAEELQERRKALLLKYGLTEEDFLMRYTCPDCQDTGFIGGERCHCFVEMAVDLLYHDSRLSERLMQENFDTLSLDYYSRERTDGRISPYEHMQRIVKRCRDYVEHFDEKGGNVLFYGPTGVGKTFLSNCIAKALMDTCHSVVYFSAIELFEAFEKAAFKNDDTREEERLNELVLNSDLLIIDDLGTERANSFTVGKLFQTVNERLLKNKATVISMNMDPNLLAERYTERVASRILSDYELMPLRGTDIRIAKRYS